MNPAIYTFKAYVNIKNQEKVFVIMVKMINLAGEIISFIVVWGL